MLKKLFLSFFLVITCILLSPLFNNPLYGKEIDSGLVIVDRKPWKTSWIKQDEKTWILIAQFEKAELSTFFKSEPPKSGFGLSPNNQPIKQELKFFSGEKFSSTNCQFEQWPDGAKAYAFSYGQKFKRDGQKLEVGATAIIDEVDGAENEIRYSLYRDL